MTTFDISNRNSDIAMNAHHAAWALLAVRAFARATGLDLNSEADVLRTAVEDLLSSLRHLCDVAELDYAALDTTAYETYYVAEIADAHAERDRFGWSDVIITLDQVDQLADHLAAEARIDLANVPDFDTTPGPLRSFEVEATRIGYGTRSFIVEAHSSGEAARKAEEQAGNEEFSEHTSEYEVIGVLDHSAPTTSIRASDRYEAGSPTITAQCHSDDYAVAVGYDEETYAPEYRTGVDVTAYFEQVSDDDILALASCGFGGDYPADAVAQWAAERDPRVQALFDYIATRSDQGFECYVDAQSVMAWVRARRPHLLERIEG